MADKYCETHNSLKAHPEAAPGADQALLHRPQALLALTAVTVPSPREKSNRDRQEGLLPLPDCLVSGGKEKHSQNRDSKT